MHGSVDVMSGVSRDGFGLRVLSETNVHWWSFDRLHG